MTLLGHLDRLGYGDERNRLDVESPMVLVIAFALHGKSPGQRQTEMRRALTRWLRWSCVLALVMALAVGQWSILQSVAWAGMLVARAQQQGLTEAVATTFDGQHPCVVCQMVTALKSSEAGIPEAGPLAKLPKPVAKVLKPADLMWSAVAWVGLPSTPSGSLVFRDPDGLVPQPHPVPELPPPRG